MTQPAQNTQEVVLQEVYTIQGHNGIILDTFNNQGKAVKEFIQQFKGKAIYYSLWQCINGRKTQIQPTGTAQDYLKV